MKMKPSGFSLRPKNYDYPYPAYQPVQTYDLSSYSTDYEDTYTEFENSQYPPLPSPSVTSTFKMPNPEACEYVPESYLQPVEEPVDPKFAIATLADTDEEIKLDEELSSVCMSSQHFQSPFSDDPIPTGDVPEFQIPSCYIISENEQKAPWIAKWGLKTLFYIFYSCTQSSAQISAAKELYKRSWRFFPSDSIWTMAQEGQWYYFDLDTWDVAKCRTPAGDALAMKNLEA